MFGNSINVISPGHQCWCNAVWLIWHCTLLHFACFLMIYFTFYFLCSSLFRFVWFCFVSIVVFLHFLLMFLCLDSIYLFIFATVNTMEAYQSKWKYLLHSSSYNVFTSANSNGYGLYMYTCIYSVRFYWAMSTHSSNIFRSKIVKQNTIIINTDVAVNCCAI